MASREEKIAKRIRVDTLPPPGKKLEGYSISNPQSTGPKNDVPQTFLDAMKVREEVFVREFNVAAENEFDADDRRSWHWVAYGPTDPTKKGSEEGADEIKPVGTVRVVPYPQEPHPVPGGVYLNGVLTNAGDLGESAAAATANRRDRATDLHDGVEPYVKLGRLSVVSSHRGCGVAKILVRSALEWISSGEGAAAGFFGPNDGWKGLVCVHARAEMVGMWEKLGFVTDQAMGGWVEEEMLHVGMFQRVKI